MVQKSRVALCLVWDTVIVPEWPPLLRELCCSSGGRQLGSRESHLTTCGRCMASLFFSFFVAGVAYRACREQPDARHFQWDVLGTSSGMF